MRRLLIAVAVLLASGCGAGAPAPAASGAWRVLVFSRTAGFRHDSIPAGIAAVRELGAANGFAVDATERSDAFTAANLRRYRMVMFLNTTGDVLDDGQQRAFEGYIEGGGGYVGVHAAADTEYGWPFYGGLVGAYFASHPAVQRATMRVEDPGTTGLGSTWVATDEWYNFRRDPRPDVHVLLSLDETSYTGGTMGTDHPIAWCHPYRGGRAFYLERGHTAATYAEPAFRAYLLDGVRYAADLGPCG